MTALEDVVGRAVPTACVDEWAEGLDCAGSQSTSGEDPVVVVDLSRGPEESPVDRVEVLLEAWGAPRPIPLVCMIGDTAEAHVLSERLLSAGVHEVLQPCDLEVPGRLGKILRHALARARATASQRREAETFRTLAENLTETLVITSASGEVQYASPSFEAFSGLAPHESLGMNALEFVLPEDRPFVSASLQMVIEGTHPAGPIQFRIPDGEGGHRVIEASGENLLDEPSVRGVVVSFRDVTQRVLIEAKLRGTQKLEAVGRLTGGIAHDFNNIMTALAGSTEMLLEDMGPDGPVGEELLEIRKGIARAAALTSRLLAYGRQQILLLEDRSLGSVVVGMEPLLSRVLESNIRLEFDVRVDGLVSVDVNQLEQVILNLVINARDAMPGGGELSLVVDEVYLTPKDSAGEVFEMREGLYMQLAVSDTGSGMTAEVLPRIFEPFFTTKPPGVGSGLGLAMAYGFVKQSQGYILAESAPGAGTTVRVYLPRVPDSKD